MRKNNGITLVSLVVTAIILLILAGVVIVAVVGDTGILGKAQSAKREMELKAYEEKAELIVLEEQALQLEKGDHLTLDIMEKRLQEEQTKNDWIANIKKEAENEKIQITTKDSYLVDIYIRTDGSIEVQGIGKDDGNPYPTVTAKVELTGDQYAEQVTITLLVQEKEKGIQSISYPSGIEAENAGTGNVQKYNNNKEIITEKYIVHENGKYRFEVKSGGEKTTVKTVTVTNIGKADEIILEPVAEHISGARNTLVEGIQNGVAAGPIEVKLHYGEKIIYDGTELTNEDRYQYKIDNGQWQVASSNDTTIKATKNCTIVAAYFHGGEYFKSNSVNILNVDTIAPTDFTCKIQVNTNSITISTSEKVTDTSDAGPMGGIVTEGIAGILRYEYKIDDGQWVTDGTSHTFNNLVEGSTHIVSMRAIDKAGNAKEATNGNQSITVTAIPNLDESIFQLNPTAGNWTTTEKGVTVTVNWPNNSENLTKEISTDNGATWSSQNPVTIKENDKTVIAKITDGVNSDKTESITILNQIDGNDPSLTNTITPEGGAEEVTIHLTAEDKVNAGITKDAASGVKRVLYGDQVLKTIATSGTMSTTVDYKVTANGTYTFTVEDFAGRTNTLNVNVTTVETRKANAPVLDQFNKSVTSYVTYTTAAPYNPQFTALTSEEPKNWYSYEDKKWANIRTFNNNNEAYWVWIPRFAYQIPNKSAPATVNVKFLKDTSNIPYGETTAITNTTPTQGSWVVHPAFNFGGTQIEGFWIAKFEMSSSNPSTGATMGGGNNVNLGVRSIPNVTSWKGINASNIFTVCRKIEQSGGTLGLTSVYTNTTTGIDNTTKIESHMIKNIEWGAVAFLSRSIYGKNSAIWNNNYYAGDGYYGTLTGACGTSQDATTAESGGRTTSYYTYNSANGGNASTTGNVYGVYDMAGGMFEYVAGYLNNGNIILRNNAGNLLNADPKFKDIYQTGSPDTQANNYQANAGRYGDAMYEISTSANGSGGAGSTGWDADATNYIHTSAPLFDRGGAFMRGSMAGIMAFTPDTSEAQAYHTFRASIVVIK